MGIYHTSNCLLLDEPDLIADDDERAETFEELIADCIGHAEGILHCMSGEDSGPIVEILRVASERYDAVAPWCQDFRARYLEDDWHGSVREIGMCLGGVSKDAMETYLRDGDTETLQAWQKAELIQAIEAGDYAAARTLLDGMSHFAGCGLPGVLHGVQLTLGGDDAAYDLRFGTHGGRGTRLLVEYAVAWP